MSHPHPIPDPTSSTGACPEPAKITFSTGARRKDLKYTRRSRTATNPGGNILRSAIDKLNRYLGTVVQRLVVIRMPHHSSNQPIPDDRHRDFPHYVAWAHVGTCSPAAVLIYVDLVINPRVFVMLATPGLRNRHKRVRRAYERRGLVLAHGKTVWTRKRAMLRADPLEGVL